jgi:Winged helix DNA-binding domain
MTREDIAKHRLLSQNLLGSRAKTPQDVVQWLGAVQAQDYSGAKWALGMRLGGSVTDADVERAFAKGAVLRTHLLRPTWHFVTPADIRWLLALTAPRVQAANRYMYRKLGFDKTTFRRCNAALTKALQGGQQRTRDELRDVLQKSGMQTDGELRMSYFLMNAELEGLICSGPRRGKQFTYALLDERVPTRKILDRREALVELAQRYFLSRGPATVNDFAKWSGLTVSDARCGLEGVQSGLIHEVISGKAFWFSPSKKEASRYASPAAHLPSVYDEYLSGYRDRSAIISTSGATRLSAMGNALSYLVVVRGQIVGTWSRRIQKNIVHIETDLFERITKSEARAISAAFREYGNFIGLTVNRF